MRRDGVAPFTAKADKKKPPVSIEAEIVHHGQYPGLKGGFIEKFVFIYPEWLATLLNSRNIDTNRYLLS